MKIIITESQKNNLINTISEQNNIASPHTISGSMFFIYRELKQKWDEFTDRIRPKIESDAKKLYPANDMVKKNPQLKNDPKYRILKDKEDAYCHQLASAMTTRLFGESLSTLIGYGNEIKGGLRIFFRGNPSRGIPKYSTFSSGYKEDVGNNKIGNEIAKKYPNQSIEFYSLQIQKNISYNNYYDSTGKLLNKTN